MWCEKKSFRPPRDTGHPAERLPVDSAGQRLGDDRPHRLRYLPGAVRRAEEFVPTVEASLWEGATHSLPLEEPEKAGAAVLDFMNRHENP